MNSSICDESCVCQFEAYERIFDISVSGAKDYCVILLSRRCLIV